jgi:elongation factor 1-beta
MSALGAASADQTRKMANVIISLRVMPESPEIDLTELEGKIKEKVVAFAGEGEMRVDIQPIAFGLKALNIIFVSDEQKGTTESLEKEIEQIEGVNSVEVTDVRRAVG